MPRLRTKCGGDVTFALGLLVGWVGGFILGNLGMVHYLTDEKSVYLYEQLRDMRSEGFEYEYEIEEDDDLGEDDDT